jgi:mannose-6-phosphate isomerase-like protein (cupin superfamily)
MNRLPDIFRLQILAWAEGIIDSRDPDEVITRKRGEPYMNRWWAARRTGGDVDSVYIHRFVRSDSEEMHDHPAANISVVLSGRYVEETPEGTFIRKPGDVVYRPATALHAIKSIEPGTTSLFVFLRREREWGFQTVDGWVPHILFQQERQLAYA